MFDAFGLIDVRLLIWDAIEGDIANGEGFTREPARIGKRAAS
jgi:hypothetical protein